MSSRDGWRERETKESVLSARFDDDDDYDDDAFLEYIYLIFIKVVFCRV